MIKSPAELALMQKANDITIEAYKASFGSLKDGMTQGEFGGLISAAFRKLGAQGGAMVISGEYTAFPHGSRVLQKVKEGDMVLDFRTLKELPAKTKLSYEISDDLRERGIKFVGSTIVYAHMQATGMVNDPVVSCYRHNEIRK